MEQKNYRDEFEQFLRDCTDDFIMIPARKVWHGIYNDIHPAKRWPSLAVALIMLFAILFVDVSNNNYINNAANNKEQFVVANLPSKNIVSKYSTQLAENNLSKKLLNIFKNAQSLNKKNNLNTSISNSDITVDNTLMLANYNSNNINFTYLNNENSITSITENTSSNTKNNIEKRIGKYTAGETTTVIMVNNTDLSNDDKENNNPIYINAIANKTEKNKQLSVETIKENKESKLVTNQMIEEKAWKEDYAFRNKPKLHFPKPVKTITYYLTPSYGFREIINNSTTKIAGLPTASFVQNTNTNNTATQNDHAALNVELGTTIKLATKKNILFKTGIQVNYTNYVSNATSIGHTTEVKLANNNAALRPSIYTTEKGSTLLNNTTLQIALPIGVDIKIVGGNSINWYIGAAVQPTYTFGGSAFLYSEDAKNYISDFSLVRKWNVNTAIESFVTFKPSSEITVQFGPQLRYQLFSTYKTEYNYKENLYNVGFKLGVTKAF